MKQTVFALAALTCALPGSYASRANANPQEPVVITPVTSADLNSASQPIVFPNKNGHVTAAIFDIAPGATLPVHEHPFPRMGYVLSGLLRVSNLESGKTETYKAGDLVLESVDQWHQGSNAGTEPLKLLVIDLMEKGAKNTITR